MRRLFIAVLGIFLAVSIAACGCPAVKQSVDEVGNSHELISTMLMDYVTKDATLTDKEKARRKTLIDTDRENIRKLKEAVK